MAAKKPASKRPAREKTRKPARRRATRSQSPTAPDESPAGLAGEAPSCGGGTPGCPVVGIGASAGGLDALKKFLGALPVDSGAAIVLIPHLAPTHQSLMVELLARQTQLPVVEATEGMVAEPNHVYIIPPNRYMTIRAGALRLTGPVESAGGQTSIDLLCRNPSVA